MFGVKVHIFKWVQFLIFPIFPDTNPNQNVNDLFLGKISKHSKVQNFPDFQIFPNTEPTEPTYDTSPLVLMYLCWVLSHLIIFVLLHNVCLNEMCLLSGTF